MTVHPRNGISAESGVCCHYNVVVNVYPPHRCVLNKVEVVKGGALRLSSVI